MDIVVDIIIKFKIITHEIAQYNNKCHSVCIQYTNQQLYCYCQYRIKRNTIQWSSVRERVTQMCNQNTNNLENCWLYISNKLARKRTNTRAKTKTTDSHRRMLHLFGIKWKRKPIWNGFITMQNNKIEPIKSISA